MHTYSNTGTINYQLCGSAYVIFRIRIPVRCIADLDPGCRGIGLNADPVGQIQGVKNHTHGKTYIFVFLVFSETLKSNNFDKIL